MLERLRSYRPGGQAAVWIVVAVALASIVTGVVAILTQPTVEGSGSFGVIQSVAEFSGTIVGFALLVTAWGMRRGYRIAYVTAALLVFLAAAHGVVQSRLLSVPLVVLSIGGLAVLVLTSERFTRSSALGSTQLGALVGIVGVFCYGTAGSYALRAQFDELRTVVDAVYFTLVTASTVGYGDVHPTTETARLFTISLVLLGPATVAVAVGSLFGPAIETHLSRAARRVTGHRADHEGRTAARVVVLGFDDTCARVVDRLGEHATVTVVASEGNAPGRLPDGVESIRGDPGDEDVLERAGLGSADSVLVLAADGADETIRLARTMTDDRIVVLPSNGAAEAVEYSGADVTIDPGAVVADATARATLGTGDPDDQSIASAASQSG